jgi:hypothetical protein
VSGEVRPGPVKLKIGGVKYRGQITNVDVAVDAVETTIGGMYPGSPPPDRWRTFVPGRKTVTLTVEVDTS